MQSLESCSVMKNYDGLELDDRSGASVFFATTERARLFSKRCKTLGCHFSGQLAHFSWFLLYHGFDHGDRDNGVAECKPGG